MTSNKNTYKTQWWHERESAALFHWARETFTNVEIIALGLKGKLGAQQGQLGR